jgi:spermidine export protein MdtI
MKDFAFLMIIGSAVLDVAANMLLKKSDGFRNKRYGIFALILVCGAFAFLAEATKTLDLAVAYVSWGALGLLGTAIAARVFLGQKINRYGWLGIFMVIGSVVLLKTSE